MSNFSWKIKIKMCLSCFFLRVSAAFSAAKRIHRVHRLHSKKIESSIDIVREFECIRAATYVSVRILKCTINITHTHTHTSKKMRLRADRLMMRSPHIKRCPESGEAKTKKNTHTHTQTDSRKPGKITIASARLQHAFAAPAAFPILPHQNIWY